MSKFHLAILPALLVASVAQAQTPQGQTKRIYHIGNSVTDTIKYNAFGQLAASNGDVYDFGRHIIPGAPLAWIFDHPENGFNVPATGHYPNALPNHVWDVLTLQPFVRTLGTPDGPGPSGNPNDPNRGMAEDLPTIREFLKKLRQNPQNATTTVYIYQRWPSIPLVNGVMPANYDYPGQWNRTYTGNWWENTNETRDYFNQVLTGTRTIVSNLAATDGQAQNPVFLVPVGDVLLELDTRMKAGQIPGYTNITQLYTDGIHFNNVGAYVVGLTFYATLYGKDPNGLPVPPGYLVRESHESYTELPIPQELNAALQSAVWDVVKVHPNVGIPEPTSLVLLGATCVVLLNRRSRQHG